MLRINFKLILSTASVLAFIVPTHSLCADDQFDPTVDYRSLKEEFAAEDAGATYGDKRLYIRMPDGTFKRRPPREEETSAPQQRSDDDLVLRLAGG